MLAPQVDGAQSSGVHVDGSAEKCLLHLAIIGIGAEVLAHVQLPRSATVLELRLQLDTQCSMGELAYSLMSGGMLLAPDQKLGDCGIEKEGTILLVRQRVRDYTKVKAFALTIQSGQYPNGVHISPVGEIYTCHYYGHMTVHDSQGALLREGDLHSHSPSQVTSTGTGELLVAFRGAAHVGVFDSASCHKLRDIGVGRLRSANGVAVSGDKVFVSDAKEVKLFSLTGGDTLGVLAGFQLASGLAVVDDRLLAVADRRQNVIKIFDIDRMELVREIGKEHLTMPNDVAVDSGGNLLVMDTGNERLAVFQEDGTFVTSFMQGFFKNYGNTFSYIACDQATGAIAVSNNDRHHVALTGPIGCGSHPPQKRHCD
jgi:DNA-binding beta-propeller fold protein YncE